MTTSTANFGSTPIHSPIQGPVEPIDDAATTVEPAPSRIPPAWEQRLVSVLWQLGTEPAAIEQSLAKIHDSNLTDAQLHDLHAALARELALRHGSDAWQPGVDVGQVPDQQAPDQLPPQQIPPPTQGPNPGPGPTDPAPKPDPTPPPVDPPPPGGSPDDGTPDLAPWLIGAGIVGAGVAGIAAFRTGARNVRGLRAAAAAFDSGAMHQGGLQSIRDAQLGARFTAGIGTREYLQVALPGINRVGSGARLTSLGRGHLDHAELMASATALRLGTGDAVSVHEPLRRGVLTQLEQGRSLGSVLDELDRSAAGARPVFDNPQLRRYWSQASILERGPRPGGVEVTSGIRIERPELAIVDRAIVETGATARINQLVAGRGARLGGRGLADGIGMTQAVNVSTLSPAMQQRALAASGIDQSLVDQLGIRGAYMQRWSERLAAAPPVSAAPTNAS